MSDADKIERQPTARGKNLTQVLPVDTTSEAGVPNLSRRPLVPVHISETLASCFEVRSTCYSQPCYSQLILKVSVGQKVLAFCFSL